MRDARLAAAVVVGPAAAASSGIYAAVCDAARCAYRSVIEIDECPSNPRIKK